MDEEKQWREYLRGDFDPDITEEERAYSRALVDALKSEQQRLGDPPLGEVCAPAPQSGEARETVIHVGAPSIAGLPLRVFSAVALAFVVLYLAT